ncbi:MAG: hypothetical protein FWG87_05855 [Defluviitaleaceae bacterium]|nr:hypothetical protein [Defluviitaleaceae bacterium]
MADNKNNGTRILRAWNADFRGFFLAFIKNSRIEGICRFFVGDGFIRPEVRTFVNSGWVTSIKQAVRCCLSGFLRQHRTPTNAERGNLGTDKSVPYGGVGWGYGSRGIGD